MSVVVCRGLTVKLGFDSDIHEASWRELEVKGSGGLSIAGWNFGLSGHYNSKTTWDLKDVTNNSVTFVDGPNVCRVIGYVVEEVIDPNALSAALAMGDLPEIDDNLVNEHRSGAIDYGEFMKRVHGA